MVNKERRTDDLENRLHNALNDHAPEAPDHLWAGIDARLQRRRRPVLWWWLIGLLTLGAISGARYSLWQKNTLAQQTNPNRPLLSEKTNGLAPSEGLAAKVLAAKSTFPLATATAAKPILTPIARPQEQLPSKNAPMLFAEIEQTHAASKMDTQISPTPTIQTAAKATVSSEISLQKPLSLINPLPTLPRLPIATKQALTIPIWATQRTINPHWQYSLTVGPLWIGQSSDNLDSPPMSQMTFLEHNKGGATGWQLGLGAIRTLTPHWRLSMGLGLRNYSQTAAHSATFRLMDGVCINPNSSIPKEYEFKYTLQSNASASDVTIRMAEVGPSSTMPADEPFTLDMETKNHRTEWLLPIAAQRTFGRGRWHGFVQGGSVLTLTARNKVVLHHYSEACADLCFATGHLPSLTVVPQTNLSFNWLLGAGLEYRLTPHVQFTVAPTFAGRKGQNALSINTGFNFTF